MASLVESGKYVAITTTGTTTNGFYVIMFTSEAYKLQDNTTIYGKIITAVESVVKAQYICSMQVETNWYWNQHPQQHVITVKTHTIFHPQLEVNSVKDFHAMPKSVCNMTQAKKSISRQPICLTDFDYNYIVEEIGCRDKIYFERDVEVYIDDKENSYDHFILILYVFFIYLYIKFHQKIYLFPSSVSIWCFRVWICMQKI